MEHRSLNIYTFFEIFWILSEVHIVQLGIIFGKHAEIHLHYRKQQIYLKILETPRWYVVFYNKKCFEGM
jgi:hypothetical protein